jgi:hypothetical protein
VIAGLVDRYGRVGFAALASLLWAVPMAAWAGSFDLSPMDKTAYPWIAFAIGLVMLAVWIVILTRLGRIRVTARPHRFDLARMTSSERRWSLGLAAFAVGLIAWLNAAATVDWGPLISAVGAGQAGPMVFALALFLFLVVMVAGVWVTWRRSTEAFRSRAAERR